MKQKTVEVGIADFEVIVRSLQVSMKHVYPKGDQPKTLKDALERSNSVLELFHRQQTMPQKDAEHYAQ